MSIPIERVDPDDLLLLAGHLRGERRILLEVGQGVAIKSDVLTQYAADLIRCAGYIRFLEARLYDAPKGEATP